jgi:hypothetical protein
MALPRGGMKERTREVQSLLGAMMVSHIGASGNACNSNQKPTADPRSQCQQTPQRSVPQSWLLQQELWVAAVFGGLCVGASP